MKKILVQFEHDRGTVEFGLVTLPDMTNKDKERLVTKPNSTVVFKVYEDLFHGFVSFGTLIAALCHMQGFDCTGSGLK